MQGLMAADIATLSKMGDLYRQADDYNNNQRLQTATFNRATDQFGSELAMKTSTANAELAAKARLSRLEALVRLLLQEKQLMQEEKLLLMLIYLDYLIISVILELMNLREKELTVFIIIRLVEWVKQIIIMNKLWQIIT